MGVVRINKNPRPALTDFIEPPQVIRLQDEFPNECVSYKAQSLATVRTLPDTVNMVFFHGKPQPHEVDHTWPADNWIKEHWC